MAINTRFCTVVVYVRRINCLKIAMAEMLNCEYVLKRSGFVYSIVFWVVCSRTMEKAIFTSGYIYRRTWTILALVRDWLTLCLSVCFIMIIIKRYLFQSFLTYVNQCRCTSKIRIDRLYTSANRHRLTSPRWDVLPIPLSRMESRKSLCPSNQDSLYRA